MERWYRMLGQLLVWMVEGPRSVLVHSVLFLGAMVVTLSLATAFGGAWEWGPIIVVLVEVFWWLSRRAQVYHFEWLLRTWDANVCPRCGYSMVGIPSGVCPECGTNGPEFMRRVRRYVYGGDPPLE